MDLPDFPSSDYLAYLNHEKEQLLLESSTCLNNMRDYLERNVFCNEIGGNFQDIIESLSPENMLSYSKCEVSAPKLIEMLTELNKYAESKKTQSAEGVTELVDYLLTLSTSQGLIMPFSVAGDDEDSVEAYWTLDSGRSMGESPTPPQLNTFPGLRGKVVERAECQRLWMALAATLTQRAKAGLATNPSGEAETQLYGQLIEVLLLFNTTIDSWKIYKECRHRALTTATAQSQQQASLPSEDNDSALIKALVGWQTFSDTLLDFLAADCRYISLLFSGGGNAPVSNAQEALLNQYLDVAAGAVRSFCERMGKRLGPIKVVTSSGGGGGVKIRQPEGRSSSPEYNGALLQGSLMDLKTQVSPLLLKENMFLALSKIIACFSRMEARIDGLLNSQWTSSLGINIDSANVSSTKKPKGVLKKMRRPSRLLSNDVSDYCIPEQRLPSTSSGPSNTESAAPLFEEETASFVSCIEWQSLVSPVLLPAVAAALQYQQRARFEQVQLGVDPALFFLESLSQPAPARASKSLQQYLLLVEEVLPLLLACQEPPVDEVVTVWHREMRGQTAGLLGSLRAGADAIASNPASSPPLRSQLSDSVLLLSDSIALQLTWSLLNHLFKPKSDEIGVFFFEQKKKFSQFQKLFSRQLVDRCYNELVSLVLQDSKSNFWTDLKEFHENTRVGYPIQAWHVYLQKFWHLLSEACPQQVARDILADLLARSLEFLVQRYAAACPSRRRVAQARADMVAVMHIVEYFVYKISDNVDELFGFGEELSKLKRIHFACMALLQVLLVLTGPITVLAKVYGPGFSKAAARVTRSYSNSYWMSVIRPAKYAVYLSNADGMKAISTEQSSVVILDLFLQSRQFETTTVIEVLCHEKMSLMKLLLQRLCSQVQKSVSQYESARSLLLLFYRSLARLADPFCHLHSVIVHIINNSDGWSEFRVEDKSKPAAWLAALYDLLEPYVEPVLELLLQRERQQQKLQGPGSRLNLDAAVFPDGRLPCGCELNYEEPQDDKADLKETVERLCCQSLHLPAALQAVMARLQDHAEQLGLSLLGNHVVLDCLLETLRRRLQLVRPDAEKRLWMELVTYLEDSDTVQSTKDMVINIYGKKLDDLEINPFQEIEDNRTAKTFFLGMQYNHISNSNGLDDLKQINLFLRRNGAALKQLLQTSGSRDAEPEILLDLNLTAPETGEEDGANSSNNLMDLFCKIGDEDFDHSLYYNLPVEWESLCRTDLGMSEIALETMLSHRWEIGQLREEKIQGDSSHGDGYQGDGGGLEGEEREASKVLSEKYGLLGSNVSSECKTTRTVDSGQPDSEDREGAAGGGH